jgi:hypothetical protein
MDPVIRELIDVLRDTGQALLSHANRMAALEAEVSNLRSDIGANDRALEGIESKIDDVKHELQHLSGVVTRLSTGIDLANALDDATESRRREVHEKVENVVGEAWLAFKHVVASKPVQIGALLLIYALVAAMGLNDSGLLQEWMGYILGK